MANSPEATASNSKLIEVLKRKVCFDTDHTETKKPKEDDDKNLDLEFVEISPEDSDWMIGESDFVKSLPPMPPANGEESKKDKNILSLISVLAAKNAMAAAEEEANSAENISDSLRVNRWHVHMKAHYFNAMKEEDLVSWSGQASIRDIMTQKNTKPARTKSKGAQQSTSKWMLSSSRRMCAFVHTTNINGKPKTTYHCNFCKLTEDTYGGFYQHINHHLFTCGCCAYHSSSRLDVEIHREYASHITPLAQGYLAHKEHNLLCKLGKNSTSDSALMDWQTIREDTDALIIIQSDGFPESARNAYERVQEPTSETSRETNAGPVNLVCALPYHRYVSQKSCRKNVLEFHCNFCQSTPIYTQELYRHVDFHSFQCKESECDFHCFTNLELFLHQKKAHFEKYQEYLRGLVIFVPETLTKEDEYTTMGLSANKWTVVLDLPRSTLPDTPSGPGGSVVYKKEREWRCKVCNNFVINKGGLTTHLVLLHHVSSKDAHLYMEPML